MEVRIFKRISEIELIWKNIYSINEILSFYQSYEWNQLFERNFFPKKHTRFRGHTLLYAVCDNRIIWPLLICAKNKTVALLGKGESCDYLSPIYNKGDVADIITSLATVAQKLHLSGYTFVFEKLNEHNPLHSVLSDCPTVNKKENTDCVAITMDSGKEFYSTLSSSTRQNYRTAKNRLQKDGLSYSVETKANGMIDGTFSKELLSIYHKRRYDCDKRTQILKIAKLMMKNVARLIKLENPIDLLSEYAQSNEVFYSVIRINGNIAAFCEGAANNDRKSISIARVAINDEYYKYSPGMIMLIEAIESIRGTVQYFDLTQGTEEYKFKLGGVVHENSAFSMKL